MNTEVVLVDDQDRELGTMEKMEAHRKGVLHRAFSVFIFDAAGRMLLQQRAAGKYHGGLLWTNACCSHPYPGETVAFAAKRRLFEEMGFITPIEEIFAFIYRADVENQLVEHEYDHVFAGQWEGAIRPDPLEVAGFVFKEMETIRRELKEEPAKFTSWFRIAFPRIEKWWQERYGQNGKNTDL
ncbi:MAG TPA: isopentenyl-diphosphate Delta-isomerase [Flavisolibacter sp.]